jgi:hydroxymethylbilane synthase
MRLRIATRGSELARAQASDVARRLAQHGHSPEIVLVATAGDAATDRAYTDIGAFGIFVRELERALLDGRADLAVHSFKDLPSRSPEGLVIAAVPERLDAADVLLVRAEAADATAPSLPVRAHARVGTSAARRQALVAAARPDLALGLLRGNVPTRVRALVEDRFDAIVLAAAGLQRLDRARTMPLVPSDIVRTRLDPRRFVPAPSQGAIAVQACADAPAVLDAARAIDDPRSARTLRAERGLLALAEAGCSLPFGAWCEITGDDALVLYAVLGLADGSLARAVVSGTDPEAIAAAAWAELSAAVPA